MLLLFAAFLWTLRIFAAFDQMRFFFVEAGFSFLIYSCELMVLNMTNRLGIFLYCFLYLFVHSICKFIVLVIVYFCVIDACLVFERMELRCVLAVIRHGDRTPKQKMKMEVRHKK